MLKSPQLFHTDKDFKPRLLRLNNAADETAFAQLISEQRCIYHCDKIYDQLKELIKGRNPGKNVSETEYAEFVKQHLNGQDMHQYGVWAYYSWSSTLVHILDEDEFVEVRTSRNQQKITREEQHQLKTKKIGVIGLSVGQSIALTLAMERTCGELRLADFDTLELGNLNRLRTGLHNLGLAKTVIAAREISEIDPYITVKIYNEGLTAENMDDFFTGAGPLDLLVEVCDSLDIKISSRLKARELRIPVVMDTNDRGMLDVERFDLEPRRSIFHGFVDEFVDDSGLKSLNETQRLDFFKALVSFNALSERMKLSMQQLNKTITGWPQLASSVVLGGAITTDISRRILLGQHTASGRYYVDLDELIN